VRGLGAFFLGIGYSVAWFAAVLNTYVVVQRLNSGQGMDSFLPIAIAAWAIIFYFHFRAGWFPFRRRRNAGPPVDREQPKRR
jgi:hypothetical protein